MIDKLKALVKGTDIEVANFASNKVLCLLPYSTDEIVITLYGTTDEEKIASFVIQINEAIDAMIDHLGDCKLHIDQTGKYTTVQVFCG
jgi:hypothetical protein